jgi:hypothetical protein
MYTSIWAYICPENEDFKDDLARSDVSRVYGIHQKGRQGPLLREQMMIEDMPNGRRHAPLTPHARSKDGVDPMKERSPIGKEPIINVDQLM